MLVQPPTVAPGTMKTWKQLLKKRPWNVASASQNEVSDPVETRHGKVGGFITKDFLLVPKMEEFLNYISCMDVRLI